VENEFVQLIAGFNRMLERLKVMATELRRQEVERLELDRRKKETQLVALQTQLNPHFLYNIFSSVTFLIDLGRTEEASAMLDATARLFRRGMYRGQLLAPLEEEVEHTRAYLAIQEIRHHGEIDVEWSVDETLLGEQVPKFVLQPLIENSLEHGKEERMPIRVSISIRRDGKSLVIQVRDDGRGMTPEELDAVRLRLTAPEQHDREALSNICERIALHYGVSDAVQVHAGPGAGCAVEMRLPLGVL
jgi:two-component system sensor histidine kinase YesM